jgi:hypothetical protein
MAAEVFIIVPFQTENRPGCPPLFSKRNNDKKLWLAFGVISLFFSHQPKQWEGHKIIKF